ncbi:unnamed protein product, partial [Rotaria sordida]
KIPYLTALVSAGPYFDSIKINEGYYLLDSRINYEDFQFVLKSISFHSVRQIFIDLPKNYNILAIIALLDFIGIKPVRCPTLEEIDSSFFWNLECGDTLGTYQLIYKSSDAKDMAVRFAIALAKEEYDFRNRTIINQIYWFIMFILSAYELFETNLRYHYKMILDDILNTDTVKLAIQESILSEICELTATLEQKYAELTKKIQAYEQNLNALIQGETQSYSLRQDI